MQRNIFQVSPVDLVVFEAILEQLNFLLLSCSLGQGSVDQVIIQHKLTHVARLTDFSQIVLYLLLSLIKFHVFKKVALLATDP